MVAQQSLLQIGKQLLKALERDQPSMGEGDNAIGDVIGCVSMGGCVVLIHETLMHRIKLETNLRL